MRQEKANPTMQCEGKGRAVKMKEAVARSDGLPTKYLLSATAASIAEVGTYTKLRCCTILFAVTPTGSHQTHLFTSPCSSGSKHVYICQIVTWSHGQGFKCHFLFNCLVICLSLFMDDLNVDTHLM